MNLTLRQVAITLALIVGLAYTSSLNGAFHFDDSHSVESNLAIRSPLNIPQFWTDPKTSSFVPENRVYRPMVYTLYSFCWLIGGGKTWPFHLMKMTMHVLVCLALFLIWQRLWSEPGWFPAKNLKLKFPLVSQTFTINPQWAAFLLAALFAIHPACSECVDYISATTSLQCAMFYVWAFWMYLQFRDTRENRYLFLALFLYFISVASKEEGITLPAMVFFTEIFLGPAGAGARAKPANLGFLKRFWKRIQGPVLAAAPFAVLMLVMAYWIFSMHPESGNESRGFASSWSYFMTQWRAYLWYMRLWFWPWDLNADQASMEFSNSFFEPLAMQAAIGNLTLLAFGWFNRKRFPAFLYGFIWFYVTISPASSVVVLAEAINEHRMYLSYIGFVGGTFTLLLYLAEKFSAPETRARRLGYLVLLISAGLVAGTEERNRVWATDENLWQDTVDKNPTSGRALNNLALVYLGRGEWAKAATFFEKCEKYWPTYMYCPLNKSIAYQALANDAAKAGNKEESTKKFAEAEQALMRAYSLNPRSVHNNFHLGRFYEDIKKDYAKAAEYFQTSIDLTGGRYPAADVRMATCLIRLKRFEEADRAFNRAASLEPNDQSILFEKGKLELEGGRIPAAVETYQRIVNQAPGHLQAWYNLGVARLGVSDLPGARQAFEKTVALDPSSEQGWFNLSIVAERTGDGKAALESTRQLLRLNPQKGDFQARLKVLETKFGTGQP